MLKMERMHCHEQNSKFLAIKVFLGFTNYLVQDDMNIYELKSVTFSCLNLDIRSSIDK